MAAVVEAEDLTRSFGARPAVDGLTFALEAGRVVGLLGPNGAGKTTTIRLLNGVLRPDAGAARVLGFDPQVDGQDVRQRTGVLTETADLDPRLTALENLVFAARVRGMSRAAGGAAAGEMLEAFGMAGRADDLAGRLSTGERKRVALARALLHRPEVLFLDEPTSGLDPEASRGVVDLIAALAREEGRTFVVCTHQLLEAERLCDDVLVLDGGRCRAFGSPTSIAADLWHGVEVDIDLGGPAGPALLEVLQRASGVRSASTGATGVRVEVEGRADVPGVVDALVSVGAAVHAVVPRARTLEDVYFALREDS